MRCGIDLDGVVYNWESTARRLLSQHTGVTLPMSTHYDSLKDAVTPEDWAWLWRHPDQLFFDGDDYDGAVKTLQKLHRAGHDLIIITQRPRSARLATLSWISDRWIPAKEVHVLEFGQLKSSVLCDWYVDDDPNVCEELELAGKRVFVMDRPWNRDSKSDMRIYSLEQVLGQEEK